jgi:hypothetical protein
MEPSVPVASPPWRFRLMILTALGVLASIALIVRAAMARQSDTAGRAALVADLRRLEAAQSSWAARRGVFAEAIGVTEDERTLAFTPSREVVLRFESRSPDAWSAIAESRLPLTAPRQCGIYRGTPDTAPHRALTRPGEVACW